ncbi:MAG: chloride channel protein [Deltaproteobacteria bacterium]|nr:chloride channel protein [Deltaproteobacteria bacterium]
MWLTASLDRYEATRERWVAAALRYNQALLRWIAQIAPAEQNRIFALTLGIGALCGLVAVLFHLAIKGMAAILIDRAVTAEGSWWIAYTLLTPTIGGLLAGVLLHFVVPEARGSGIPQVKAHYLLNTSRIRLRDAVGKFFVASLQIGSGASLGREGPTVHICAGVASAVARLFALSPTTQRRMVPVGAAAGIAAAFNAPIAAVTFVIEELVGALDTTVLSGVVVAAAIAAVVEHGALGEHPVLYIPPGYGLKHASSLLIYAVMGFAAAGTAHAFSRSLLALRARFRQMARVPPWVRPAIGGLVTGVLAVVAFLLVRVHGIAGGGYEALGEALRGGFAIRVLLVLGALKIVSTVFSYSSGGSGGIFAPVLFIGAMLGGVFGYVDHWVLGHHDSDIGAFAVVGMGAVFAGVIRAPITSVLLMFEMTGGYGLVLPLMLANMVSYIFARQWSPKPIYEALLEQDGIRLPGSGTAPVLGTLTVREAMTSNPITLESGWTVAESLQRIRGLPFASFPTIDASGRLAGMVSEGRLRRMDAAGSGTTRLAEFVRPREYLRPADTLRRALETMGQLGVRQMGVVDDAEATHLVGVISMSDVMRAMLRAEGASGAFPPSNSTTTIPISAIRASWEADSTKPGAKGSA